MPAAQPQPILAPLTPASIFLVATIDEGGQRTSRATSWPTCPDCNGPSGSGSRRAAGLVTDRFGWLGPVVRRAAAGRAAPVRELGVAPPPATPGDLLFHIRAERMDLCFELADASSRRLAGAVTVVDEMHGFKYFDERDLLGFVDGTENPTGPAARDRGLDRRRGPDFAGGSYVIVQKYLHDLTTWNAMTVEEQERVIGRTKLDDIELPDDVKPAELARRAEHDRGRRRQRAEDRARQHAVRQVGKGEFGTYFIGYAPTPTVTEQMLATCSSATAGQHRPDPRFLDGGHRHPVLRADRRLARRPAAAAGSDEQPRLRSAPRRRTTARSASAA